MTKTDSTAKRLRNEYAPLRDRYQRFAEILSGIMLQLSTKSGRKCQFASARAKDPDRLFEKVVRKRRSEGKQYKCLDDIEDLAGIRIIFYLEKDRYAFCQDLKAELGDEVILGIQEQNKTNGYRATHLILKLDDTRLALPEYAEFRGMKCELQITSALYHAWSEVEHDIVYKLPGGGERLVELGLDRLQAKFKELHLLIKRAAFQFDLIHQDYERIREFGDLLDSNLVGEVIVSSNDRVVEILSLVHGFVDRKPDEAIAIIETVFKRQQIEQEELGQFGGITFLGKTRSEVDIEALRLLERVRYLKPELTLTVIEKLLLETVGETRSRVLKVLEKLVEYNCTYIDNNRSYHPQNLALQYIAKWTPTKCLKNLDFVETISKKLLCTAVEGSEMTDENTLAIFSGTVKVTDDLKKIRKQTIDLLERLFHSSNRTDVKLRVLRILATPSVVPPHVTDEELKRLVSRDVDHILSAYKKMVLGSDGRRLKGPLSVLESIERRLYWWSVWNQGGSKAADLRMRLLRDRFYQIAHLLIGEPGAFQLPSNSSKAVVARGTRIVELAENISKLDIDRIFFDLTRIAKERKFIEEWRYIPFRDFVRSLSAANSRVGDMILRRALKENGPLASFACDFLVGFRLANRADLWVRYSKLAIRSRDSMLTGALVTALQVPPQASARKWYRPEDISCLADIVHSRNGFEFLDLHSDALFQVTLFQVLCSASLMFLKKVEPLLRVQFKLHPSLFTHFADRIMTEVQYNSLSVSSLNEKTKRIIRKQMIETGDFTWRAQGLLLELGKADLRLILDTFVLRIRFEERIRSDGSVRQTRGRYDAVPYDINSELAEFVATASEFPTIALDMLEGMTAKWSIYNWEVARLLDQIGSGSSSIIKAALERKSERSVLCAAYYLSRMENVELELCMKVIGMSDEKSVKNLIDRAIFSTGIVMGDYGVADFFQKRAEVLRPYTRSRNQKIRRYAKVTIQSLEKQSAKERLRVDDELAARHLAFEYSR